MKFKYTLTEGKPFLVGMPEMGKPDFYKWSSGVGMKSFWEIIDEYENHIASLPKYPLSKIVDEWIGREDIDSSEFELKRGEQKMKTDQQQWQEMSVSEKDEYFEKVAVPIVSNTEDKIEREFSEHELLMIIKTELKKADALPFGEMVKAQSDILNFVTIKRK